MLINDANWTTLPGLSYLVPEQSDYEHAVEELELGGHGFIAPSTRVIRPREFLVNDYSLVSEDRDQCNAILVSLRAEESATIARFNLNTTFPADKTCLPLHPQLQFGRVVSQDFLLTELDCLSPSLHSNCGYLDLQSEAAAYLEVRRRLIFPLRAPFVGQICVVQEGVALQTTDCDLGIPGCLAIVHDPRLVSDADGLKAVRDATWESIRLEMRQRFRELAAVLSRRPLPADLDERLK
jgi:hypothetical protein